MYRGLTTFKCTNCGHLFKSHNIEYKATWLSVPQRCPQCGNIRTMPINGTESTYKPLWEEMEKTEKEKEEIVTLGATWFPPGTPLKIDEE